MQQLTDLKSIFDDYLKQQTFQKPPEGLYEPVRYIMSLSGKRLRPTMVLMAYQMFRKDYEAVLPVAFAVEIFHNFTLLHDDIMDEAPLRRGKPTVHKIWNSNTAINAGDVMLVHAYDYLSQVGNPEALPHLLGVFNRVARQVCEGQQMDMDFEQREEVSIEQYLKMIELKTAVLMSGSLEMGAIVAGASRQDQYHAAEFGRSIGIAFQLQDDILDTFGDPQKVGKKPGGDIIQNKKTFLILKALELATGASYGRLRKLMTTPTENEQEKVAEVRGILEQLNIPALAGAEKNRFRQEALDHLQAIEVPEFEKRPLYDLKELLVSRDH